MTDCEKLLEIVAIHIEQALNELEKCKDINSDFSKWHLQIKNIFFDISTTLEGEEEND